MSHWVSAWGQAHTELRFFTPKEIELNMISPPIRPVFRKYFEVFGKK